MAEEVLDAASDMGEPDSGQTNKEDAETGEATSPGPTPPEEAAPAADAVAVDPAAVGDAEAVPAEDPKPILLWRPARFERQGQRRHDHRPRHGRGPAEAATEPGERPAQQRQDGRPPFRGRREGGEGADSAGGKPKFDRSRFKGPPKPQGEGGRPDYQKSDFRKGKREDGRSENRGPKPAFQPRPREERPAKVDPLSPFAKLAALRDQLQPKK